MKKVLLDTCFIIKMIEERISFSKFEECFFSVELSASTLTLKEIKKLKNAKILKKLFLGNVIKPLEPEKPYSNVDDHIVGIQTGFDYICTSDRKLIDRLKTEIFHLKYLNRRIIN